MKEKVVFGVSTPNLSLSAKRRGKKAVWYQSFTLPKGTAGPFISIYTHIVQRSKTAKTRIGCVRSETSESCAECRKEISTEYENTNLAKSLNFFRVLRSSAEDQSRPPLLSWWRHRGPGFLRWSASTWSTRTRNRRQALKQVSTTLYRTSFTQNWTAKHPF